MELILKGLLPKPPTCTLQCNALVGGQQTFGSKGIFLKEVSSDVQVGSFDSFVNACDPGNVQSSSLLVWGHLDGNEDWEQFPLQEKLIVDCVFVRVGAVHCPGP